MFSQIKDWYDRGFINDATLDLYRRGKIITQEEYGSIIGGNEDDNERN